MQSAQNSSLLPFSLWRKGLGTKFPILRLLSTSGVVNSVNQRQGNKTIRIFGKIITGGKVLLIINLRVFYFMV